MVTESYISIMRASQVDARYKIKAPVYFFIGNHDDKYYNTSDVKEAIGVDLFRQLECDIITLMCEERYVYMHPALVKN